MSKRKYYQISFEAFSRDCGLKFHDGSDCHLAYRLWYKNILCIEKNCPKLKRVKQLFPLPTGPGQDRQLYIGLYPDEIATTKRGKK